MQSETTLALAIGRVVAWLLVPLGFAAGLVFDNRIDAAGGPDSTAFAAADLPFIVSILVCWALGVVLTWRVVNNAVGWLFLALATAITFGGACEQYAEYALRTSPGSLPGGGVVAVVGDTIFAWWFFFLALCLQLTPTGRPLSRRWVPLVWLTVASTVVFQIGALLRSTPLEAPNAGVRSPLAIESAATLIAAIAAVAVIVLGLCLLASVYAVVARFRASEGEQRQQMLWLVVGITPLPLCVIASFAVSYANHDDAAGWAMAAGVVSLALGAGFSIFKYRLYGVETVVGQAVAYVTAATVVVLAYAVVVVAITKTIPGIGSGAQVTTVVATLGAAAIALPAYRLVRNVVDRRFNRRKFDAVQLMRAGLRDPTPDLGALMITALGDPSVRITFPASAGWVSADGRDASPGENSVVVVRRGATAAKIAFDPEQTDRIVVEAVALEAAAEIDNLSLRAELAGQVQQIRESRQRLASAHLDERRRMERDLHDGAQQRLLAIALQLQSARVNGSADLLRDEAARAIDQLAVAVQELRDLANGLQPSSLAAGGLRAAVEDLSDRIPLRLRCGIVDRRFSPAVEGAAWFVIAEAVSNAVKYAGVGEVAVCATVDRDALHVTVTDEGVGGADPRGSGLQGLRDRVAALGGRLVVSDVSPHGTTVEAVLPCGS